MKLGELNFMITSESKVHFKTALSLQEKIYIDSRDLTNMNTNILILSSNTIRDCLRTQRRTFEAYSSPV